MYETYDNKKFKFYSTHLTNVATLPCESRNTVTARCNIIHFLNFLGLLSKNSVATLVRLRGQS